MPFPVERIPRAATQLDERYFARELPHNFKFGVTGCQNNCLKAEENDVGIKGASIVEWEEAACINCGICEKTCRVDAISTVDGKIVLDEEKCNNCGRCVKACPTDAWKATPAFEVSFGGLFGNRVKQGREVLPLCQILTCIFKRIASSTDIVLFKMSYYVPFFNCRVWLVCDFLNIRFTH